jgi:DNA-binding PadR family transcriptional regulator
MPKTGQADRRTRNDLDLFILALINDGATTPYELRTVAGLSSGATLPALARLVKAGHLSKGRAGARGRRAYAVTLSGNRLLERNSKFLLKDKAIKEFDGVLRTAGLALILGHRPEWVAAFLRAMSNDWLQVSAPQPMNQEWTNKAQFYKNSKQVADSIRLKAEVTVFRELATLLTKKK